jgi:hypothetical protein
MVIINTRHVVMQIWSTINSHVLPTGGASGPRPLWLLAETEGCSASVA